jgi:hypothetical protein
MMMSILVDRQVPLSRVDEMAMIVAVLRYRVVVSIPRPRRYGSAHAA